MCIESSADVAAGTYLASENAKDTLVQVHDGIVATLVPVHDRIRVETNDEKIAQSAGLLQKVEVSHVKQVERTRNVHLHEMIIFNKVWFT